MDIKMININDVIPYENNAKKHPEEQVEHIANSIKRFGWKQPIVIDKENVVVVGHGRLLAAQKLGYEQVPVLYADDLTPQEINAFRLADNKTNESDWDIGMLKEELSELLDDFDMKDFGFKDYELDLNDEYIDDFFDRGVEAKEKPTVFGLKVYCDTLEQLEECKKVLKEAGYNPEEL